MNRLELYPGCIITDRYGPTHIFRRVVSIEGDIVTVEPLTKGRRFPVTLRSIEQHWRTATPDEVGS